MLFGIARPAKLSESRGLSFLSKGLSMIFAWLIFSKRRCIVGHNIIMAARNRASHSVRRATNSSAASIQNVGVNHSGVYIPVPQQLLNSSDVISVLQQVRRERMPQGVIILLTNSLCRRFITDITPFMERKSK